jgi:hypothetical protein
LELYLKTYVGGFSTIQYYSTIQRCILWYELFNELLNRPRMKEQVNLLRRHNANIKPEAATCEPIKFDAHHYYVDSFLSNFLVTIITFSCCWTFHQQDTRQPPYSC